MIELNVPEQRIDLLVDEKILIERRKEIKPPIIPERGWKKLYKERVMQAHLGADMDFL